MPVTPALAEGAQGRDGGTLGAFWLASLGNSRVLGSVKRPLTHKGRQSPSPDLHTHLDTLHTCIPQHTHTQINLCLLD